MAGTESASSSAASGRTTRPAMSLGASISAKNQQKRSLQVVWKGLDLERQHFLKLMALNEKLLRSRQGKREDRMTRLQSHLTGPQIAEIERETRLQEKTTTTTSRNGAKTGVERASRGSDDGSSPDRDDGGNERPLESAISTPGRSLSFYGLERTANRRVRIANDSFPRKDRETQMSSENGGERTKYRNSRSPPRVRAQSFDMYDALTTKSTRPHTQATPRGNIPSSLGRTQNAEPESMKVTHSMPAVTPRGRTTSSLSSLSTPSAFSCHRDRAQEAGRRRSQSVGSSGRSWTPSITSSPTSASSTTSVFHDAMEAIRSEGTRSDLRNLLVVENELQAMQLQRRKDELMSGIMEMVKRDRDFAQNRRNFLPPTDPKTAYNQDKVNDINDLRLEIRRRKNERMRERIKVDIPTDQLKRMEDETEDEYAKRLEKCWRDLRKVRYLRRQTSMADFSDVVTLAVTQQKNNQLWAQSLRDNLF